MASGLEAELCCPVCQDVFEDPVLLSCSHSFCRDCLLAWWSRTGTPGPESPDGPGGPEVPDGRVCPLCRTVSQFEPTSNRVLKNLCESFLQDRVDGASLCPLHQERLQLFCVDHRDLVCLICRDSERHRGHTFRPVSEAARSVRQEVLRDLEPLRERLTVLRGTQEGFQQTVRHIADQAAKTRTSIRRTFQTLHRFLAEEEEARMSRLREEEERKSVLMKKQLEALGGEIEDLTRCLNAVEEELKSSDSAFLLNNKAIKQKVQRCPLVEDPTLPSKTLIDVSKHLGNLSFHIWSKMKDVVSYCPLVLDPNSAAEDLVLSADLTAVSCGDPQILPVNPERLKSSSVLASQAFSSGSHWWDVEVGRSSLWEVGVVEETAQARGDVYSALWRLGFYQDQYLAYCPSQQFSELSIRGCPRKIRVRLDWDKETLSFSDPDGDKHLHTFKHKFTDRLLPFFSTLDTDWLRVLARDVSVVEEQI